MYKIVLVLVLAPCIHCFNQEVDEQFRKLPHDEFIKYFNGKNFSWKIKKYDNLGDKILDCVEVSNISLPIKQSESYQGYVPKEYDARERRYECYANFILGDQKTCGSCWAITVAAAASVRSCFMFPRGPFPLLDARLAPWDLTCCKNCFTKDFCSGGSPERAALFYLKHGLVSYHCQPSYTRNANNTACMQECYDEDYFYNGEKHFGSRVYVMPADDHEIRRDIAVSGPLIATFALYEDFKDYKSGIYEHTHGKLIGHHSVLVVGYGVEDDIPYWIVSNTWGYKWGDHGYFKIKRFQQDLGFETKMIGVIPKFNFGP